MAAKKGKIKVVEAFEHKGIKLGQKIKVSYFADKEEVVIGVDTDYGDFLITNSGSKNECGMTLKEEIEKDGFMNVVVLKGYENTDALKWSWIDRDNFIII